MIVVLFDRMAQVSQ